MKELHTNTIVLFNSDNNQIVFVVNLPQKNFPISDLVLEKSMKVFFGETAKVNINYNNITVTRGIEIFRLYYKMSICLDLKTGII